jgi:hypothetical protein
MIAVCFHAKVRPVPERSIAGALCGFVGPNEAWTWKLPESPTSLAPCALARSAIRGIGFCSAGITKDADTMLRKSFMGWFSLTY